MFHNSTIGTLESTSSALTDRFHFARLRTFSAAVFRDWDIPLHLDAFVLYVTLSQSRRGSRLPTDSVVRVKFFRGPKNRDLNLQIRLWRGLSEPWKTDNFALHFWSEHMCYVNGLSAATRSVAVNKLDFASKILVSYYVTLPALFCFYLCVVRWFSIYQKTFYCRFASC